jgi:hypothetical protein
MSISKMLLIGACALLLGNGQQEARGWRGLVPLQSTRSDVERLLGRSADQCKCIYKTDDAVVFIEYSKESCTGNPPGWNVPVDKVLSISVRSQKERRFSELNLDLSKYVKTLDDTFTAYYTNNEQGITYEVSQSGVIHGVIYSPSLRDNALRCPGWPLLSARQALNNPQSFDDYSDIPWPDETGRLDNFAIALQHDPKLMAYIIVYAGQRACVGEAEDRARRAKKYLVETRGIQESRVKWIDGGYREELTVILQPIPPGAPELTTSPTLKPSDVQIIKSCKPKTSKRKKHGS